MTVKEAILKSLEDIKGLVNSAQVYQHIVSNGYYSFEVGKTPASTVSALLGDFIRNGDTRMKRIKGKGSVFLYYLTKHEQDIGSTVLTEAVLDANKTTTNKTFKERDLHKLLSSYLENIGTYSKTIFHEQSRSTQDSNQKWIHPDMIGISFLKLQTKESQTLLKAVKQEDTFKISSYELKKEINTDYELKKSFFQAVSNSSWAHYGYLVAFEIADSLLDEIERLSQSFGIGVIELKANPYESKVLYPSKYKELDFKTVDKLCHINPNFRAFIEKTEKLLTASERYVDSTERELVEFCDAYFKNDSEIDQYCKEKHIPTEVLDEV